MVHHGLMSMTAEQISRRFDGFGDPNEVVNERDLRPAEDRPSGSGSRIRPMDLPLDDMVQESRRAERGNNCSYSGGNDRSWGHARPSRNSQSWQRDDWQQDDRPRPRRSTQLQVARVSQHGGGFDRASRRGSQWSGNGPRRSMQERQDPRDIGCLPNRLIGPSRVLASFLRHTAGTQGYPTLDTNGYMSVRMLSTVFFKGLHELKEEDIHTIVNESYSKTRKRFELHTIDNELMIRATHNHSLQVTVRSRSPQRLQLRSRERNRSRSRNHPRSIADIDHRAAAMDVDAVGPAGNGPPVASSTYTPPNAPPGMLDAFNAQPGSLRVKQENVEMTDKNNKENEAPTSTAAPTLISEPAPSSGSQAPVPTDDDEKDPGPPKKVKVLNDFLEELNHQSDQVYRQLNLKAGAIITTFPKRDDQGWSWGEIGPEDKGWFPTSFAQDIPVEECLPPPRPAAPKAPPPLFRP